LAKIHITSANSSKRINRQQTAIASLADFGILRVHFVPPFSSVVHLSQLIAAKAMGADDSPQKAKRPPVANLLNIIKPCLSLQIPPGLPERNVIFFYQSTL
jgi:hypothetical protein